MINIRRFKKRFMVSGHFINVYTVFCMLFPPVKVSVVQIIKALFGSEQIYFYLEGAHLVVTIGNIITFIDGWLVGEKFFIDPIPDCKEVFYFIFAPSHLIIESFPRVLKE